MPETVKLNITKAEALAKGYIDTPTAAKIVGIDNRSACKNMKNIGLRSYAVNKNLSFFWERAEVTKLAVEYKAMKNNPQLSMLPPDPKPVVVVTSTKEVSTKAPLKDSTESVKPKFLTLQEFRKVSMTPSLATWKLKSLGFEPAGTLGESGTTPLYHYADAVKYRDNHSRNGRKAKARLVSKNANVKVAVESSAVPVAQMSPDIETIKKQYGVLTKMFEQLMQSQVKKS